MVVVQFNPFPPSWLEFQNRPGVKKRNTNALFHTNIISVLTIEVNKANKLENVVPI